MAAKSLDGNDKLPRFNHYVPQFVLENFAQNGKLSIFDKHIEHQYRISDLTTQRAIIQHVEVYLEQLIEDVNK
jgi:hypothetical protein